MHVHNADPTVGPVCSQFVTDAINVAWGIVTRQTDKVVGTPVVTRDGCSAREAFVEAWGRKLVRVCTREPVCGVPKIQSAESAAESFAWAEAHRQVRVA